jgi:hypothetical protein
MLPTNINKILTKHNFTTFNKYFWQKGYYYTSDLRILIKNNKLQPLVDEFNLNQEDSKKVCKILKRYYYFEYLVRLAVLVVLITGVLFIAYFTWI